MTNTPSTTVTQEDREKILSAIWHRNSVRRDACLPLLDVGTEFHREVTRLLTKRYTALLQPYLLRAMSEMVGHPGIAGRLVQRLRATQIARRRLLNDTGIDLPVQSTSSATGSFWLWTIFGRDLPMISPVFCGRDAPKCGR